MAGFKLKDGLGGQVFNYPEHATANSFQKGDVVDLNGGKVRLAAADSLIWGVALKSATGTVDTDIPVMLIDSSQLWVAYADTTTNQAHVGDAYGLNLTAGSQTVDIGDTTDTSVVIVAIDERDAAGTTARVIVRFIDAVIMSSKE